MKLTVSGPDRACPNKTYRYIVRVYTDLGIKVNTSCVKNVGVTRGSGTWSGTITYVMRSGNEHHYDITFDNTFGEVTFSGGFTQCGAPASPLSGGSFSKKINTILSAIPRPITGDGSMCPGQTKVFTSPPPLQNDNIDCFHHKYSWTIPSGWIITGPTDGNSISLTAPAGTPTGNYTVSVRAWWNDRDFYGVPTTKTIFVGAPPTSSSITGSNSICGGSTGYYSVSPNISGVTYTWEVLGPGYLNYGQGTGSVSITFSQPNSSVFLRCTPSSACGTTSAAQMTVYVSSCFRMTAFPNPVSNELNITSDSKSIQDNEEFRIEILDENGISQKRVKYKLNDKNIDLGNLRGGVYYVHIYKENDLIHSEKLLKQ